MFAIYHTVFFFELIFGQTLDIIGLIGVFEACDNHR